VLQQRRRPRDITAIRRALRAAPLDAPCRRARAGAGDAIGREALDAGAVASGASIKPGDRSRGEPLGAGPEGERQAVADPDLASKGDRI
jgi:hypothetical protein